MQIVYNAATDLLYIQMDVTPKTVINHRLSDDIVVDVGKDDRIVGIEILDASKRLDLAKSLLVEYAATV